ncbi:MAG: zeta toxin family protein, partial [Bdellovibrionales bacterium]
ITPDDYYKVFEDYQKNPTSEKEKYEKILDQLVKQEDSSRDFFKDCQKREDLHEDIYKQYLDSYKPSSPAHLHIITGSIASGKTSIINNVKTSDTIFINFDEIKFRLPEYGILKKIKPKKAASFVQSESSKLAGKLYGKAIKKGVSILYEKNMTKRKDDQKIHLVEELVKANKKGYKIYVHVVFLGDVEEAYKRAEKRFKDTGRFVNQEKIKDTYDNLFPYLLEMIDKLSEKKILKNCDFHFYYNPNNEILEEHIHILSIQDKISDKSEENIKAYTKYIAINESRFDTLENELAKKIRDFLQKVDEILNRS